MKSVIDLNELCRNSYVVALRPDAALEHMGNAETLTDIANIDGPVAVLEDRRACWNRKPRDLDHSIDDLFGDAVREVFLVGIGRHVDERQDGDGTDAL